MLLINQTTYSYVKSYEQPLTGKAMPLIMFRVKKQKPNLNKVN